MEADWQLLVDSWQLELEASGYSPNTLRTYQTALRSLAAWAAEHHPGLAPTDLHREHVRGWLAAVRRDASTAAARSWLAGVRSFTKFLMTEGEAAADASAGVRTPPPGEPATPVLSVEELRRLVKACQGTAYTDRRDAAVVLVLLDAGLRLAELAALTVEDVDLRGRVVRVTGKGSRRSGPRYRTVPLGVKAAQALDRYLRARRRRHPPAHRSPVAA